MNYDELISGYFDGELTPEQDEALRQEMANNPELKADFDDAVFMHYALKNDAQSLDVPEDLKRNTHDLVMMRMLTDKSKSLPKSDDILLEEMAKTTSQEPKLTIVKRWHSARHFVASVAAVLILGFVNVSEYSIFRHLNDIYTYQNDYFDVTKISQNNKTTNTKIVYRNIIIRDNSGNAENIDANLEQNAETQNAVITNENSIEVQAKIETSTPKENSSSNTEVMSMLAQATPLTSNLEDNSDNINNIDIADSDFASEESNDFSENNNLLNSNLTSPKAMQSLALDKDNAFSSDNTFGNDNTVAFSKNINEPSSWINPNRMSFNNDKQNVNLELKSYFAGNTVFNSYMNNEHMISLGFSQSIGYSLDGKNKFGIEIGNINQSSSRVEMMEVRYQQFAIGDAPLEPSPKVLLPYKKDENINYLWGSIFYEYNFIKDGYFNLDGRINIGANGKGAMNILRLTASYKIFGAINLSIGLDNRSFFVNNLSKKAGKTQFINSMSLIYGLEFSF